MDKKNSKTLMVSGSSPVKELAGSVVKSYESGAEYIELRAIGAGATNQCAKALATARGIFATKGKDLTVRIGFDEVEIDDEEKGLQKRTVLVFNVLVE